MSAPILVVTGTGTAIGKTFVAVRLVEAWARTGRRVAGRKPVESGASSGVGEDISALDRATAWNGPPAPYVLEAPVSPHLAARREGRRIDLTTVTAWIESARATADGIVVELPGGLFTPLDDRLTNADVIRALTPPHAVLLVAPDRLGVLHDVIAATRAATASGVAIAGIVLSTPTAEPDAATGTNAAELSRVLPEIRVLAALDHGSATHATFEGILRDLNLAT